MAIIRGEQGSVEFETGSGTLATVVGTRSWTLNITKETLDTSVHGNSFRQFVGSMISGSGTVELVYDPCLLYTSPSPRDRTRSRMPSSA